VEYATYGPRLASGANAFLTSNSFDECMETGVKTTVSRSLFTHDNLLIEGTYFGTHE
jgi:hypothetical protein